MSGDVYSAFTARTGLDAVDVLGAISKRFAQGRVFVRPIPATRAALASLDAPTRRCVVLGAKAERARHVLAMAEWSRTRKAVR